MARCSKTEFAILGLLSFEPLSGYDIKIQVEQALAHFWSESIGNIYPALSRLQQRGLVSRTRKPGESRPDRFVYAISRTGRERFQAWMRSEISSSKPRNEVLLRTYFGSFLPPDVLAGLLVNYREDLTAAFNQLITVRSLVAEERKSDPHRVFYDLTLDFGIRVYETLIEWCNDSEAALGNSAAGVTKKSKRRTRS